MGTYITGVTHYGQSLPGGISTVECTIDADQGNPSEEFSISMHRTNDPGQNKIRYLVIKHTTDDIFSAKDPGVSDDYLYTFVRPASDSPGKGMVEVFKIEYKEDPDNIPWKLTLENKYEHNQSVRRHRYVLSKAKKQLL